MTKIDIEQLRNRALPLLRRAGVENLSQGQALAGGRNNFVVKLTDGTRSVVLKSFFQEKDSNNQRALREIRFVTHAYQSDPSHVPKLLAADEAEGLALYEFVAGRGAVANDVTAELVEHALQFVTKLNADRDSATSKALLPAAESCLTIHDHVSTVGRRLQRLVEVAQSGPAPKALKDIVQTEHLPLWNRLQERASLAEREFFERKVQGRDLVVSPSDFGFHNTLITSSGAPVFIDFEYAGIDDPAKMVADFFCQPRIVVEKSYLNRFLTVVSDLLDDSVFFQKRFELIFPLYHLKWACMVLNEFVPEFFERRQFSSGASGNIDYDVQLQKARILLVKATELL